MSRLDNIFYALSDATRRAILQRLCEGEATIGELAQPFNISLPAVSKHIKILENAGLIARGREKQTRPCRLQHTAFKEIDQYLALYRRVWNQRLDKLEHLLSPKGEEEERNK